LSDLNWKEIAPHRADWDRLTVAWVKAGLPVARWVNGEPVFPEGTDMSRVRAICEGRSSPPFAGKKQVAAPSKKKTETEGKPHGKPKK
jgi:hypothetical protein